MGIGDMFKGKQFKSEIETLTAENERLTRLLSPEMQNIENQRSLIAGIEEHKLSAEKELNELEKLKQKAQIDLDGLCAQIDLKKNELIQLDDEILFQEFGVYTPTYNLMSSEAYKEAISTIRARQKYLIQSDTAATYRTDLKYNNSLPAGRKMVKNAVKQVLRAFNNECDAAIAGVKFNNVESMEKRISKSKSTLENLNKEMRIIITGNYYDAKIKELKLCHEYAVKKQEEKEAAKAEREALREEAKLQKEIEEARKNILKEQTHYKNALEKLEKQISENPENSDLILKRDEIISQLGELDLAIKDIDYREANKRAGYVYIISNIGSFGENVYKIGMTRRLEPLDRVNELGDASVPFNFDLHAMIFSDDAPTLENALHQAFEHKKVNMINQRREFFHVTLEEIESVVKSNYDKTVDFIKNPQAEQFRESQMLKKSASAVQFEQV